MISAVLFLHSQISPVSYRVNSAVIFWGVSVGGALLSDSLIWKYCILLSKILTGKDVWIKKILLDILVVEWHPRMVRLAQSYNRGAEGEHRCGGSAGGPPRSTHHYCFNRASRVRLTLIQGTHTHSHTKPQCCLKSQSKLAPKGIPTTLFTKGIVYVFECLAYAAVT